MRRPRGPGGRFLTAEEIAAKKAAQVQLEHDADGDADIDVDVDVDVDAEGDTEGDGSDQAKKAEDKKKQNKAHANAIVLDPRLLSLSIPSKDVKPSLCSVSSPANANANVNMTETSPFAPSMFVQQQQQQRNSGNNNNSIMLHPGYGMQHQLTGDGRANGGPVTLRAPYASPPSPTSASTTASP
ncbi:hypothetical protein EW145_g8610, partial [Phellinidium pouzarii]